jgi:hypothetical protein
MSSVSDPLLPVQTSAMHDADIDVTDPAQSEVARERRFRWIRLAVLAVAGEQSNPSDSAAQLQPLHAAVHVHVHASAVFRVQVV